MMSVSARLSCWLLLAVMAAGALEMYDDASESGQGEQLFQMNKNIDSGPLQVDRNLMDDGLLLYRLFASPHPRKLFKFPYRSRWIQPDMGNDGQLVFPKRDAATNLVLVKRNAKTDSTGTASIANSQKKKKVTYSYMLCYFKLCALAPVPIPS